MNTTLLFHAPNSLLTQDLLQPPIEAANAATRPFYQHHTQLPLLRPSTVLVGLVP